MNCNWDECTYEWIITHFNTKSFRISRSTLIVSLPLHRFRLIQSNSWLRVRKYLVTRWRRPPQKKYPYSDSGIFMKEISYFLFRGVEKRLCKIAPRYMWRLCLSWSSKESVHKYKRNSTECRSEATIEKRKRKEGELLSWASVEGGRAIYTHSHVHLEMGTPPSGWSPPHNTTSCSTCSDPEYL